VSPSLLPSLRQASPLPPPPPPAHTPLPADRVRGRGHGLHVLRAARAAAARGQAAPALLRGRLQGGAAHARTFCVCKELGLHYQSAAPPCNELALRSWPRRPPSSRARRSCTLCSGTQRRPAPTACAAARTAWSQASDRRVTDVAAASRSSSRHQGLQRHGADAARSESGSCAAVALFCSSVTLAAGRPHARGARAVPVGVRPRLPQGAARPNRNSLHIVNLSLLGVSQEKAT
jgi:hypothetical protein